MWFKTDIKRRLTPVRRGDNTDVFFIWRYYEFRRLFRKGKGWKTDF